MMIPHLLLKIQSKKCQNLAYGSVVGPFFGESHIGTRNQYLACGKHQHYLGEGFPQVWC